MTSWVRCLGNTLLLSTISSPWKVKGVCCQQAVCDVTPIYLSSSDESGLLTIFIPQALDLLGYTSADSSFLHDRHAYVEGFRVESQQAGSAREHSAGGRKEGGVAQQKRCKVQVQHTSLIRQAGNPGGPPSRPRPSSLFLLLLPPPVDHRVRVQRSVSICVCVYKSAIVLHLGLPLDTEHGFVQCDPERGIAPRPGFVVQCFEKKNTRWTVPNRGLGSSYRVHKGEEIDRLCAGREHNSFKREPGVSLSYSCVLRGRSPPPPPRRVRLGYEAIALSLAPCVS